MSNEQSGGFEMDTEEQVNRAEKVLALGGNQLLMGRHEDAIARFREALRMDPSCCEAYIWLGRAYREIGNFRDAERAFLDAVQLRPDYALARFHLGLLYISQDELDKAVEQYRSLKKLHPLRADRLFEQIEWKKKHKPPVGKPTEKDQPMQDDSNGKQSDKTSGSGRSKSSSRKNKTPEEPVNETPSPAPEIVSPEELMQARSAELAESPSPDVNATEIDPDFEIATGERNAIGIALPGRAPESVIVREPEPVQEEKLLFIPDSIGESEPEEPVERKSDYASLDSDAHWRSGQALLEMRDYARAAEDFERAIAMRPDFCGTHPESVRDSLELCMKAGLCYERLGKFEKAAAIYEKALMLDPDHSEFLFRKGLVMLMLNRPREAAECFRFLALRGSKYADDLLKRLLPVLMKN